jgi:hypothetical protein
MQKRLLLISRPSAGLLFGFATEQLWNRRFGSAWVAAEVETATMY